VLKIFDEKHRKNWVFWVFLIKGIFPFCDQC